MVSAWLCAISMSPAFAQEPAGAEPPPVAPAAQSAAATVLSRELARTVRLGETVSVTDRHGLEVEATVRRIEAGTLEMVVAGQPRIVAIEQIGRVEKDDRVWNGFLIGVVPGALTGAAVAGMSCSPNCARDVPRGALAMALAAGAIGALVDAVTPGYRTVAGPRIVSRNAIRMPPPVSAVSELWQRVRAGDSLQVTTPTGRIVFGRFARLQDGGIVLPTSTGTVHVPASTVQRVTRRGNRYRTGMLIGGAGFAVGGALVARCDSPASCGSPAFTVATATAGGALWGAIIGAAIAQDRTVLDSRERQAGWRVTPILGPRQTGAALTVSW